MLKIPAKKESQSHSVVENKVITMYSFTGGNMLSNFSPNF